MKLALPLTVSRPIAAGRPTAVRSLLPGLALAVVLALAAGWIAVGLGDPLARNPVLVAMLFGLVIGNCLVIPDSLRPGLQFTMRYLLRLAVVLVGFRITVRLLAELGWVPLTVAAIELVVVLVLLRWIAVRVFKLDPELALLVATGSAVCGAAAILAMAATTRARQQNAGIAIALITLVGTVALLLYPIAFMGGWLAGLGDWWYGVFVGSSIYELAQVYGASFAVSEGALYAATLVKLSKVLMLVPLLLFVGLWRRRRGMADPATAADPLPFPWFIVAFVGVMLFNSAFTLHPDIRNVILNVDQFLFLMVMVALGLSTRLSVMAEGGVGWRLIGTGAVGLIVSTTAALLLVAPLARQGQVIAATGESAMLADAGGRLFGSVGCAKCHVPALAGEHGDVLLYSDLLLHDMGPALDDKIVQGNANGADWRTTPLVGLAARQRFLHDGRASTLRDAILAHGGEAEIVRKRFFGLSEADRQAIYEFLGGL
jgi:uncharacterized integral membrane protein (TIGR00698 family)